jgi:hypothetical protein
VLCREQLTDVTLSCGGTILNAHSLLLSVCSPYFRSISCFFIFGQILQVFFDPEGIEKDLYLTFLFILDPTV